MAASDLRIEEENPEEFILKVDRFAKDLRRLGWNVNGDICIVIVSYLSSDYETPPPVNVSYLPSDYLHGVHPGGVQGSQGDGEFVLDVVSRVRTKDLAKAECYVDCHYHP